MHLYKKLAVAAMALVMGVSIAACSVIDEIGGAIDQAGDAQETEKYNAYIDLSNEFSRFYESLDDYAEEFGWEKDIDIEDNFSSFSMYTTSINTKLEKAMTYVDKKPELAPDAATRAMEPKLKEYCQKMAEADTYYDDKSFLDDDFAKGKTLHTYLVTEYDVLEPLMDDFSNAIGKMTEGETEKELKKYKDDGDMVHYYALQSLVSARAINQYLYNNDILAANILDIKQDDFKPLYDAFLEAYNGYQAENTGSAAKDEGVTTTTTFDSALKDVKASVSELWSRVREGKEFSKTDLMIPRLQEGTPEKIDKDFDSMLSAYNTWFT